jgi:hypothetical protein
MHTGARFATELRADVQFAQQLFFVDINELNVSGVEGTALLALRGNELTAFISATGLTPGQIHPQHIHGFANDQIVARTPTIAFDEAAFGGDEDGLVELAEGLDTYGPILLNLTPFPTAPNGAITFATTYNLTNAQLDTLQPLQIREIVLHGMNVLPGVGAGTPGEVNGTGGYITVLPVASGEMRVTSQAAALALLDQAGIGTTFQTFDFGTGSDEIRPVGHQIVDAFDFEFYRAANPDVAAAGIDPLVHYNTFGFKEGRDPNAYFDTSGYLEAYEDVAAAGVNPLRHYLEFGAREGRDPSVAFDTTAYLAANPDVAAAGVNPLNHFLQFGIYEGRSSFGDGAFDFA